MALSYDLLSQFAKLVNKEQKTSTETTAYGKVVVDENGDKYVKLDGSDQLTPLGDTSADAEADERVSVLIKNHTATVTGNMSHPAASTTTVKKVEILLTDKIQAAEAYIKKLDVDKIDAGELDAAVAKIEELVAKKATIEQLNAAKAEITDLVATKVDAEVVEAKFVTVEGRLEATEADIGDLNVAHAEFKEATVKDLEAQNAEIGNLKAEDVEIKKLVAGKASVEDLEATNADIENLKAKDAEIEELVAEKASIEDLEATNANIENLGTKYANIDFANIGEAAVRKIFSDTGLIRDLVVGDHTVTGEFVGVTIIGDYIKAGTVKADKLVVKGSDGIYYKLNVEAGGVSAEEAPTDSLHGSVITAKSITAEKVSVKDLVAFGATIGGFHITENSLYSGIKSSARNTTRGVYQDSEGQFSLGDMNNYLRYFRDENGKYKLEIAADQFTLSSGKSLEESIAENLEIGARNLIRNSKTMIFADYYFPGDSAVLGTGIIGAMVLGKEG